MRSVLSDLYPEPRPGGSAEVAEDEVQVTASLPSTSAPHRLSTVRTAASAASATEKPTLGSRSLSFIKSGVSAVSSLFTGPKRSGELQRIRSASTPNRGKRRTARPARPRTPSRTGASSPRHTAGAVSDGDSPRQPASRETVAGTSRDTGQARGQSTGHTIEQPTAGLDQQLTEQTPEQEMDQTSEQHPEQQSEQQLEQELEQHSDQQPEQHSEQLSEQQPEQQPEQQLEQHSEQQSEQRLEQHSEQQPEPQQHRPEQTTGQLQDQTPKQKPDQIQDQPPDQTPAQPADKTPDEVSEQTVSHRPEQSSREWSAATPGHGRGRGRPRAEDLDSEGRSVTSETTSHTDTETVDADEERTSLDSEPFSSGPEDDGSQRGPASTVASDGDDNMSVSSPRSNRRVTFDENASETLMFIPELDGRGRGSDEGSVTTVSTDSDSEESPSDSFRRLLEVLRERSLTPVGHHSDEGETSGHQTVDPTGHMARYLREQEGRPAEEYDESDIQEDEVHPYREERRLAFPNEPPPGGRRNSFGETIDEFLHYLQAIAEDHKAHQEAMTLLDEEPLPAAGSDVASEAGDSTWSEISSEMADSVSEPGSVQTEVDSGLATSPPPLPHGENGDRRPSDEEMSIPVFGSSAAEADTEAQSGIPTEESYHANDIERVVPQEPIVRADKTDKSVPQRDSDYARQENGGATMSNEPVNTTNFLTVTKNSAAPDDTVVSSSTSAPRDGQTTVESGGLNHSGDRPAGEDESLNQSALSETNRGGSEDKRSTSSSPGDTAPTAVTNLPTAEASVADLPSPADGSSPIRSEDSSRESSAADSRRGSAMLRSLLRASLPAAEVLGSHSDTDTLQERRASLAGGLLPPTADLQGRSPGQTGSLEMMATSPGELSKQPTPADSGEASDAVSESEMWHHQPVRSLATIADRLLRGDSEEEAPRVVPSGIGPANSMAAISSQLLTDRSPGEPADLADIAAIDEADDETELHSIIMHGEVAEQTEAKHTEIGNTEAGPAGTGEMEAMEQEVKEMETSDVETRVAETAGAEIVKAEAGKAEAGKAEAGEAQLEKAGTGEANIEEAQAKMEETREPETGEPKTGEPETEGVELDEPKTEWVELEEPETEWVELEEPRNEDTDTVAVQIGETNAATEDTEKQNTDEEYGDVNKSEKTDAKEAKGEIRAKEPKVVEEIHYGGKAIDLRANHQDVMGADNKEIEASGNIGETSPGAGSSEADNGQVKTEKILPGGAESKGEEEAKVLQKAEEGTTHAGTEETTKMDNNEKQTKMEIEEVETNTEAAGTEQVDNGNAKTAVWTGNEATEVDDASRPVAAENTQKLRVETGGETETNVETEDIAAKIETGEASKGVTNEENMLTNVETAGTVTKDDRGETPARESTGEAATEAASAETSGEEASKIDTERTAVETGKMAIERTAREPAEKSTTIENKTEPSAGNLEHISGLHRQSNPAPLSMAGSDGPEIRVQSGATADGINDRASTSKNEENEAKEVEKVIIPKQPEGSTSMTAGAPNIAIQTSTRLTLDVDGLGSVTSDIARQESYESYSDDNESGSENSLGHSDVSETLTAISMEVDSPVDDERAQLEAVALLDSEGTDESSLRTAVRTHAREEGVMSGMRRRDDPGEMTVDEMADPRTALPKGSTDEPNVSDSRSTMFSDLRSEASEHTKESEMDQDDYYKDRIRLTSDGESATFDDDEIFESETITRLGMLLSTTSARKLVWSLIAMASGIVDQVQSSETKVSTSRIDYPQLDEEQKKHSQVQIEDTANYETKTVDDSDRATDFQLSQPDKSMPDDMTKEADMTSISKERTKEIHRPQVKEIIKVAEAQIEETMRYDTKNIADSHKATEALSPPHTSIIDGICDKITQEAERANNVKEQLREIRRPQVKEIIKAAEVQFEETMNYKTKNVDDSGKTTEVLSQLDKSIPDSAYGQVTTEPETTFITAEQLKETHRPQIKEMIKVAEVHCEEAIRYNTEDNDDSSKTEEFPKSDKTISDVICDEIAKEAQGSNISADQLKEIYGPQMKEIIKTAEEQVISAAQKVISIIKQTISREITKASGHEAIGYEDVNNSSNEAEITLFPEQGTLTLNNETLDVDQNLAVGLWNDESLVDLGNEDIQVGLKSENTQDQATYSSSENVSKRTSETRTGEKSFLLQNVIYELIPKQGYETDNLEKSDIEQVTDDLAELEEPSPQDIAGIAVAITHSVLGEAADIVDDEQTAARRLRVRKSIIHAREGLTHAAEQQHKSSMDEESDLTSEMNRDLEASVDSDNFDDLSPDDTRHGPEAAPQETEEEAAADAGMTPDIPPADVPVVEHDTPNQESVEPITADGIRPGDAPVESQDDTAAVDQQSVEPEPAEPEPAAVDDIPPPGSVSESDVSDTMIDEGQDTMDSNRIRYETGEIADQTQNVTSEPGITEEMLNAEPEEGAVTVDTDVAGEDAADELPENAEAVEADDTETAIAEEQDGTEDQPDAGVEAVAVAADDADADEEASAKDSRLDADEQNVMVDKEESSVDNRLDVGNDGVTVSVMHVDELDDPLDPDLVNLPTQGSEVLLPIASMKKQSSWLAKDIVAPDPANIESGTEERDAVTEPEAGLDPKATDVGEKKNDGDADDILAQYANDTDLDSSGETEETTESESSGGSQETLQDEDAPGDKDNVFDWLRRVSTQMDKTGITDQLKEMYGDDIVKPIVMAPSMEEEEEQVPEELPEMVSPKTAYSDTGMYHESSLSLDKTYRIRQSSTQTDVKDSGVGGADGGREGRTSAARHKPCGSCPCCLAMKKVVSGGEGMAETEGVRRRPAQPKERQKKQQQQQRPWTSPTRSVGDLLDDTSSTTVSSTSTTSSVDGGDSYARRMKHPKRWLKQATDEFMRRECIRQVVLKNDLVSEGRIQTKVTRISRHPSSMTDCLAATRGRAAPGQSLQMEISKGETLVGGRTVNYQDVKIRTPKSCSGLSVRSAPRTHSSRPWPQDEDVSKRFIDTYLAQSQVGSQPGRTSKSGRESKTRKKITIKTDCRK